MQTLTINGKEYQVDVPNEMPLLWVLRDIVGLTGTKFGCGIAQCGACSIRIDDRVVRSCSTPVSLAKDKQITTIEGSSENLEYLRQAWAEISVPQCGYCQSGQLVSAAALLDEKQEISDQDIDEAMSGNICRCGTYVRIRKAIHKAVELRNSDAS
ncbi:(2Fe-2S)-binding protein [Pseudotenacibaculum sp. MALMAid0570]|uniref:(2Fe-2S)-binding protein n=1 Tax=Pseudotenacibaculum sp. MALMAid0570 TaxID=3143938 RepID=UPI0032DF6691